MSIRLLIADADGTLVTPDKTLTPRTIDAVARLKGKGIEFTLTSGRPPRGLAPLVKALNLNASLAAFNGGVYIKSDLKTVLLERSIPHDVAIRAIDYLLDSGLDAWLYQGADWFIRKLDAPRVAKEMSNVGFRPTVVDNLRDIVERPIKIVGVSLDRDLIARCEIELAGILGTDASAMRSTPVYVDITHPDANKGMVVRDASRLWKIPTEQIAVIGDMSNDVPMMMSAGVSIAMGNAPPEVKRVAQHVTESNEDEGFAHAVDAFILGASSQVGSFPG